MAAGLPVIAFNNPAENTILAEGAGTLVSKPADFVHKTLKLLNNEKYRAKQIRKEYQRITTEIKSSIMVEKLVALLKQTAEHSVAIQLRRKPSFLKTSLLELYALNSFFDGEKFIKNLNKSPASTYNMACRKLKKVLESSNPNILCSLNSKSTPGQYLKYLPSHKGFFMLKRINKSFKP